MANIILSKESSCNELKSYFEAVLKLSQSDNEFPINLNDVWMLAYPRKDHAVRFLKENFINGIDYQVIPQKGENPKGGRPTDEYMLTTSCLEYFIARKVRPVFEVYREVFHKAAKEPMFRESEIKGYLLIANESIKNSEKKCKAIEKELTQQKARTLAVTEVMEQEKDLKNSCFSFLLRQGLYNDWHNYHVDLIQKRKLTQLEKERKEREKRMKNLELPF